MEVSQNLGLFYEDSWDTEKSLELSFSWAINKSNVALVIAVVHYRQRSNHDGSIEFPDGGYLSIKF